MADRRNISYRWPYSWSRGHIASGFVATAVALITLLAIPAATAAELPRSPEQLLAGIKKAIEERDYAHFKKLIFWKDAGKIKRRVVRFQINRGLGRPVHSITFEDFPKYAMDGVKATGKLVPNMKFTNAVRVVYDEAQLANTGKRPTAVFLVGRIRDAYRIGLVVRKPGFDDDDD